MILMRHSHNEPIQTALYIHRSPAFVLPSRNTCSCDIANDIVPVRRATSIIGSSSKSILWHSLQCYQTPSAASIQASGILNLCVAYVHSIFLLPLLPPP